MPASGEGSADDEVSALLLLGAGGGGIVDAVWRLRAKGLKVESLAGAFRGDRILRTGAREVAVSVCVVDVEGSCPYIDELSLAEAAVSLGQEVRESSSEVMLAIGAAYRLDLTINEGLVSQRGDCLNDFDPRGLVSGLIYGFKGELNHLQELEKSGLEVAGGWLQGLNLALKVPT